MMKPSRFFQACRIVSAISVLSIANQAAAFDLKLLPAPSGGYTMTGTCDVGYMVQVTAHLPGQPLIPGVTLFKHQQLCGLTNTVPNPPTQSVYFNHPGPKFVFSSTPPKPQPAQLKTGIWIFEAQEIGPKGTITFPAFKVAIP
jgi:hypothetical protein